MVRFLIKEKYEGKKKILGKTHRKVSAVKCTTPSSPQSRPRSSKQVLPWPVFLPGAPRSVLSPWIYPDQPSVPCAPAMGWSVCLFGRRNKCPKEMSLASHRSLTLPWAALGLSAWRVRHGRGFQRPRELWSPAALGSDRNVIFPPAA